MKSFQQGSARFVELLDLPAHARPSFLAGSATITVTLNSNAIYGAVAVALSSSNTAAFSPPASITVAAGQISGSATVITGTVSASTPVTVTGSYNSSSQQGSVTVLPPIVLTSVSVNPLTVISTNSATVTVTLSGAAPSGGAVVTLSSNNTAAFNPPASVTVGAGQVVGYVTVTAGAVTSPASVVVTGSYNGSSQPGPITVAPPPDFTITLTPSSNPATAMVGGSAIFTVAVSPANGFSGTVTLTALGLPTGASATFSPATITGSGTSTMTVTAPASGTGNFTVTANGSSGSLSHNAVSSLAVQDFTVTLSPYNANNPPTVAQGGSQTFTISTAGINGFTGNIGLNYVVGSPQCQLSNLNVPPPAAAGSAAAMTLYLTPYFTGPCYFQVSATANGDTHLLNAWLDVISSASFGLTLPPSQGALTATPTAQPTVVFTPTLTIVNNFCGTIDFQVSGLPVGATASAPPVYLCANSPQTAQITVTVAPGTPQGTSPLTINAYGANGNVGQDVNQYLNPILQVGSGGSTFSISASAPQTTAPGGTAQYTITVNGSAGLGNVTLTASGGPPGATVQLGSASVAVGGQTTLTVVAPLNEGLGAYPVSITGMLGTVPKYATALTNVAQAAPASIISPTPGALPAGQNTFTFTWNSGIGATQYQLAVSSSPSGANCSSAAAAQSSTVTLVSDASPLYATLSSLTPAGCLAQSYVYYVPSVSLGTLISWGSIVIRPGAPPVTVSSPVSGDTITGCSVPSAGVTAVIAGAAGSQTVTFTASATASQGTTTIACSTAGLSTLLMNAQYVTDADGISDIQRMQTGPGLYHISIFGFGFGDNEDGGANVYVGGAATLNGFTWTDNDVEIDMTVPDGVCGTYAIVLDPDGSDFDDPDDFGDFAPAPLETSVEACPDVPAPAPTLTLQMNGAANSNVAGTTQNVIIGQYVGLAASVSGASGPVSYQWTAPQNTAINWNPFQADSTQGQPVPIPANQLNSSGIDFAWTSTAPSGIMVAATLSDGSRLTAGVSFNIAAPSVQATAAETGVVIVPLNPSSPTSATCPNLTGTSMCLYSGNGAPGIAFSYTPAANPGDQYEWVQVVNGSVVDKTDGSGNVCEVNVVGLDGGGVYYSPDGVNASDSPGLTLTNPPYVEVSRSDTFSMFLMYMPQSGIWVPLYQINWGWSGDAVSNGAQWSLKTWTSTNPPPVNSTSSYPTWTQAANLNAPCNPKQ